MTTTAPEAGSGRLGANVMHFARLLRRAGLPVGMLDAMNAQVALREINIGDRDQTRAALRATLVRRHEYEPVFEQAFAMFWRDPEATRSAAALAMLEGQQSPEPARAPPAGRRIAEAMAPKREAPQPPESDEQPNIDAALTVSERERLQTLDFEAMSTAEIASAKAEIRLLTLPLDLRPTRRRRADPTGPRVDLGRTIRDSRRTAGEVLTLARTRTVRRPPPLVILCDISGSMARYAPILLHFLHAVTNHRDRVAVFLFGTRLSNVTRQLRARDPEVAFEMVSKIVPDWSGGTRIGSTISKFNRDWSRRVLSQRATVLLITDGLDREGAEGLDAAMARLHRSCRRLIWLNPLLRWKGFEPKTQGIRAMLPHVDEFRTVHNLDSLRTLIETLSRPSASIPDWRSTR